MFGRHGHTLQYQIGQPGLHREENVSTNGYDVRVNKRCIGEEYSRQNSKGPKEKHDKGLTGRTSSPMGCGKVSKGDHGGDKIMRQDRVISYRASHSSMHILTFALDKIGKHGVSHNLTLILAGSLWLLS